MLLMTLHYDLHVEYDPLILNFIVDCAPRIWNMGFYWGCVYMPNYHIEFLQVL